MSWKVPELQKILLRVKGKQIGPSSRPAHCTHLGSKLRRSSRQIQDCVFWRYWKLQYKQDLSSRTHSYFIHYLLIFFLILSHPVCYITVTPEELLFLVKLAFHFLNTLPFKMQHLTYLLTPCVWLTVICAAGVWWCWTHNYKTPLIYSHHP